MRISFSLLQKFIDLSESPEEVAEILTELGLEVDHIHQKTPPFSGVVAAEVKSISAHPHAKKLQVAEVFDGKTTHQIVCGAPNCRAPLKVALAKVGATLQDLTIQKTSIREVESSGMLCSEKELGLSEEHEGILELPQEIAVGADLQATLWDPVLEISLTPNLGHCMSAKGVARELSAYLKRPLKSPLQTKPLEHSEKVSLQIDPDSCPYYAYQTFENVKIGPSPFWLQLLLKKAGISPISNVVDITNYLLLKRGQPMHAFDLEKLQDSIEVAPLKKPVSFKGLDENTYALTEGTLCVLSGQEPVAIAGVLGGKRSAISSDTSSILLEAAVFNPVLIRKSLRGYSLRTESALRFEKGIDAAGLHETLQEASFLLQTLCGARPTGGTLPSKEGICPNKTIPLRAKRIETILGTHIALGEIQSILNRLEMKTEVLSEDSLSVEVPYYRHDVTREIDLIEEVARIFGYQNLSQKASRYHGSTLPHDPAYLQEELLRKKLLSQGLQETLTSDLISPTLLKLSLDTFLPDITYLKALHAKTEEYSILRPSLLPNLLSVAKRNLDHKNKDLSLFEIGRIHFLQKETLVELPMLGIFLLGQKQLPHWSSKTIPFDFFDLKGQVESLLASLHIKARFSPKQHTSFHPYRACDLYLEEKRIGSLGELHPLLLEKIGIEERAFFAEISLEGLTVASQKTNVQPLSVFPASERDLTLTLSKELPMEKVFLAIDTLSLPLLEKWELIDLYFPENTAHKNATVRFTYRDPLKTVLFEEVEKEHTKLTEHLTQTLCK